MRERCGEEIWTLKWCFVLESTVQDGRRLYRDHPNVQTHSVAHMAADMQGVEVRTVRRGQHWRVTQNCITVLLCRGRYYQFYIYMRRSWNAWIYFIFIGPCINVIVENKRPTWCHLLFIFHFLCVQHASGINISITRSLRLFCWITTLVVCSWFDVRWRFGVIGLAWYPRCRLKHHWSVHVEFHINRPVVLQPATRIPRQPNHTETPTHIESRTWPTWQSNRIVVSFWWWIY